MNELHHIQAQLKSVLKDGMGGALNALQDILAPDSVLRNDLVILESRLLAANRNRLQGILSDEDLQLTYNKIRVSLISLIDSLSLEDIQKDASIIPDEQQEEKPSQGQVLYQIPTRMELKKESKCVVRVAFLLETVVKNIELTSDTKLQQVRISDLMQVELLAENPNKVFDIRTISSKEQFVDKDHYTEWIFYVTPHREGSHDLLLKVAVIELIYGKERKREFVLEENIEVVTEKDSILLSEDSLFSSIAETFQLSAKIIPFASIEEETGALPLDVPFDEHSSGNKPVESQQKSIKELEQQNSGRSPQSGNILQPSNRDKASPENASSTFPVEKVAKKSMNRSTGIWRKVAFSLTILSLVSISYFYLLEGGQSLKNRPDYPDPGYLGRGRGKDSFYYPPPILNDDTVLEDSAKLKDSIYSIPDSMKSSIDSR